MKKLPAGIITSFIPIELTTAFGGLSGAAAWGLDISAALTAGSAARPLSASSAGLGNGRSTAELVENFSIEMIATSRRPPIEAAATISHLAGRRRVGNGASDTGEAGVMTGRDEASLSAN